MPRPTGAGSHGKWYGLFRDPCFTTVDASPVSDRVRSELARAWTGVANDMEKERKRASGDSQNLSATNQKDETKK
ncbi:hypothetical protein HKX48_001980, partial [Thoreauomyces humboldtii]